MMNKNADKLTEKIFESYNKEEAMISAILLSFDLPILYDYVFPPEHEINDLVIKYIQKTKLPIAFKTKLMECVDAERDSYSRLVQYVLSYNDRFGREWFCGYGTLARWRNGEREKAEERVAKYLTKSQKKEMAKLQEAIKIRIVEGGFKPMIANIGSV